MKPQTSEMYESLIACLAELDQIRPMDLLNDEPLGQSLRFRTELPYLGRTLEIFHRLSRRDLTSLPADLLRDASAIASETLGQFRAISTLAEEHPENLDELLRTLIGEIKSSFDRISAIFAVCDGWEQPSRSGNAALAIGVCTLVVALALVAYFSSHDKAVADVLLKAVHGIGLS